MLISFSHERSPESRLQIGYSSCMVSLEMSVPSGFLFYYPSVLFLRSRVPAIMVMFHDGRRERAKGQKGDC